MTQPDSGRPDSGFVVARLGKAEFGIALSRVQEVVHTPRISRLPFAADAVSGIASLRGAVLPVLDLGERLLGLPALRPGRMVVVDDPETHSSVGLLVDSVAGILSGEHPMEAIPPESEASLPSGWVSGVVLPDSERIVTILELDPVLRITAPKELV